MRCHWTVEGAWNSSSHRLRLQCPTMLAVGPRTCYLASLSCDFLTFKCHHLYYKSWLGERNEMKTEGNSWVPEKMCKMPSFLDFCQRTSLWRLWLVGLVEKLQSSALGDPYSTEVFVEVGTHQYYFLHRIQNSLHLRCLSLRLQLPPSSACILC